MDEKLGQIQGAHKFELRDGDVVCYYGVVSDSIADGLFEQMRREVDWKQEYIRMFGKEDPLPRLTAWFGDPGHEYKYSGIAMKPEAWIPPVQKLRETAESLAACQFNSVLCNFYRNGRDKLAWHSDDERELGLEPTIASVNLGAPRRFWLRRKDDHKAKVKILLSHGDVLVMRGTTQEFWEHSVFEEPAPAGERINLTFRQIVR